MTLEQSKATRLVPRFMMLGKISEYGSAREVLSTAKLMAFDTDDQKRRQFYLRLLSSTKLMQFIIVQFFPCLFLQNSILTWKLFTVHNLSLIEYQRGIQIEPHPW